MKLFSEADMFAQDENLCNFLLEQIGDRFKFLDINIQLEYCLFLVEVGLWDWNMHLMEEL